MIRPNNKGKKIAAKILKGKEVRSEYFDKQKKEKLTGPYLQH